MRGLIDRLWGGPGLRRGRRNPHDLQLGDAVDFWRVEEIVDGELLRLRAEMKLPGRAWLDLGIVRDDEQGTLFHQRAVFAPKGLLGRAYWWSVWPFHGLVFGGMQRNIARQAEDRAAAPRRATIGRADSRPCGRHRRRTVVVTATIDGRRGAELNPKRTGGSTSASAPRSTPSHVARDGVDAVAVRGAVELLAAGRLAARADAAQHQPGDRVDDRRPPGARGDGRRDASQHPPERVPAADRDVGDERSAGEPQRVGLPLDGPTARHDRLVEHVHRRRRSRRPRRRGRSAHAARRRARPWRRRTSRTATPASDR